MYFELSTNNIKFLFCVSPGASDARTDEATDQSPGLDDDAGDAAHPAHPSHSAARPVQLRAHPQKRHQPHHRQGRRYARLQGEKCGMIMKIRYLAIKAKEFVVAVFRRGEGDMWEGVTLI